VIDRGELFGYLAAQRYGVQASAGAGGPQAAVVGIAVTEDLEIVFDTLASTRKMRNLERDPRLAFVIGWSDEQTAQLEGVADFPQGAELRRLQRRYFEVWPDGPQRLSWPGITYVRVKPRWIRYSDFRRSPPRIEELTL
jgi:hypothetical protein